MTVWDYETEIAGEFRLEGTTPVACPTCHATKGLKFFANADSKNATAVCPKSHEWDERAVTTDAVIHFATQPNSRHFTRR